MRLKPGFWQESGGSRRRQMTRFVEADRRRFVHGVYGGFLGLRQKK
jgi:hypothetical protein